MAKALDIANALEQGCREWLSSQGFPEVREDKYDMTVDDMMEDFIIEIEVDDGRAYAEVRAELGYNGFMKLLDVLDPIIQKFDKDAYFDMEEPGISRAYFNKRILSK